MNTRNDDMLRAAAAFTVRPELREDVKQAFANIPRAPLSRFIDDYVATHPNIDLAVALKTIADLNQGTLDDLDTKDFQSYVVSATSVSEVQLRRCAAALGSYRLLKDRSHSDAASLPFAARENDTTTDAQSTLNSELLEQLKKRTR